MIIKYPNQISSHIYNLSKVKVSTPSYKQKSGNFFGKIENEINSNQSKLSTILGALIVLVLGILIFNFFNKSKPSLGPAQQTQQEQQQEDVSVNQLPGKYTVKEGDTLFLIAEKYYQDGYKYSELAKVNSLNDPDLISTGQVLQIPKLTLQETATNPLPLESPQISQIPDNSTILGTGGGNTTIWGPKIEDKSYTVVEGDWLSTIAARAYGDISAYQRIADANHLANPNHIVPGTVLTIPR